MTEGHVLARLDDTRYRLTVNSVQAQIETATQQRNVAAIELAQVIPAQRVAAVADLTFRKSEYDRNQPLVRTGAVTRAEVDRYLAEYNAALAAVTQVDAEKQAKQAEHASLQAKIDELSESLAQAKRDVADCALRSPFRGQVARVHIIPGGVVRAGQPVVTVQMMDPIKVELEVSGKNSRLLNYRDIVNVIIPQAQDGELQSAEKRSAMNFSAFVYSIDPIADPATRTFTVTLLMRNEKLQSQPPPDFSGPVVRARDVWELNEAPHLKQGARFVEANAIHGDGGNYYVWKVTNWEQVVRKETAVLNVSKVRVIPGDMHVDWLGLWTFHDIVIAPGEEFDVDRDLVAGALDTTEPFAGGKILLDRQNWRLRPGDLVGVELSGGRLAAGFFVPMDAIRSSGPDSFVFEVSEGRAKRVSVKVSEGPNTLKRIEATGNDPLAAGMQLVAGGVHYLTDGEAVNVVEEVQVQE
jgi:multidrug efflux pump subunit AcrA (membrane-fusion protein)